MKAGAGKSKGAGFERDVSRRLSLWLSNGERDDLLWRSAMSGGRATLQYRKEKINLTQSGDLSAVGQGAYEFCERTFTECKFYNNLQIDRSILCGTGSLIAFWKVAVRESKKYKKRTLLIARQNRFPTLAITGLLDDIFIGHVPLIVLNHWSANVYLFDTVTKVHRPLMRRRS